MARPADPHLRTKLLAASAAEFAGKGFVAATVESITSRAGYSKAAFYLHFDSKVAAFRELVTDYLAGIDAIVHDDDSYFATDPGLAAGAAVLQGVVDKQIRVFEYMWDHRVVARLVVNPPEAAPLRDLTEKVFESSRKRLSRFIEWGARQGYFEEDVDAELASLLFSGAHERLMERIITSRTRPDIAKEVRRAYELLTGGFLSKAMRAQNAEASRAKRSRT